ncbi:uncharacterized protein [Panulirus ornatus]|uniref:uncharacterized protein n=1 Tax=Panulirus ornatus TaxID=150431 RepID=UPI003A891460
MNYRIIENVESVWTASRQLVSRDLAQWGERKGIYRDVEKNLEILYIKRRQVIEWSIHNRSKNRRVSWTLTEGSHLPLKQVEEEVGGVRRERRGGEAPTLSVSMVLVIVIIVLVVAVAMVVVAAGGLAYHCYRKRLKLAHTTFFDDSASFGSYDEGRMSSTLKTPLLRFQSVPNIDKRKL